MVVTRSENPRRGQLAGIGVALGRKRRALRELRARQRRSQQPQARGKGYMPESRQQRLAEITHGQYVAAILKTRIVQQGEVLDFTFPTAARAFVQLQRTRLGKGILCTDNDHWSTAEIILGSRAQFQVDNAFKQMKDPHWVTFSPTCHWTDQQLRVQAFYGVLALTLGSLLQRQAARAGVTLSLPALRQELSDIKKVVHLYPPAADSRRDRRRAEYVLTRRSPQQRRLAEIFGLDAVARRS